MNNAQQLPDLGKSFAKMRLQDLIASNQDKSLFAGICQTQVYENPREVFIMLHDQIKDNRVLVIEMFGVEVVKGIESLKL